MSSNYSITDAISNQPKYKWLNHGVIAVGCMAAAYGLYALAFIADVDTARAAALASTGIFLILLGRLDEFEVLKGLGFEAARKKLEATVSDATVTIQHLSRIAEVTGRNILEFNASQWRSEHPPEVIHEYRQAKAVREMLEQSKADRNAVESIMDIWARSACSRAYTHIINEIFNEMLSVITDEDENRIVRTQLGLLGYRLNDQKAPLEVIAIIHQYQSMIGQMKGASKYFPVCKKVADRWLPELAHVYRYQDIKNESLWAEIRAYDVSVTWS